jgi:methylthioribose-1-phosphate isomerase
MINRHKELPTLYWKDHKLYLIDQRYLPGVTDYRVCTDYRDVIDSIREMTVRGAPAIGISAAFGLVIEAEQALEEGCNAKQLSARLHKAGKELIMARPTAVNLSWAVKQMISWLDANIKLTPNELVSGLENKAIKIFEDDIANNRLIGKHSAALIPDKATILTHCNAGALATGGYGTALGVIRTAWEQGKAVHVYIDETRPLLQGARLTAFELYHEGIPATLVTDNCAGHLMALKKVDLIVVGADRIAANGDAANKIGTYSLAVLAKYHKIPFYIAAPLSTIDLSLKNGSEIVIEERACKEVTHLGSHALTAAGVKAFNPAFDITPTELISAIFTEKGVVKNPTSDKIRALFEK